MIQYVTLANCAEFDAYICACSAGHFMQRSAWGRCRPDWQWQGLMSVDGRGRIRAAMVLLCRRVSGTGLRQFYSPRGPVFDRGNLTALGELLQAAQQLVREQHGYLLRMDPQIGEDESSLLRFVDSYGFRVQAIDDFSAFQPRLVYQVDLAQEESALWARLHHKTRYNIGLAQRRGLQVAEAGLEGCGAFAELLSQTGQRVGFHGRSRTELENIMVNYGDNARLWLAMDGENAVAGLLNVTQGHQMWNLYSASSDLGRHHKANELLQWYAITQAKAWGCRLYDLRGVEGLPVAENPKCGLHRFKQNLGAELVCYAGQMDWVCRPVAGWAISLAQRRRKRRR